MANHSTHGDHTPSDEERPRGYAVEGHALPGGLAHAANGLRFNPSETRFDPNKSINWTFQIVDDDGAIVTDFEEAHGERSHLIVVRRDLTRFQHLHPELEPDGMWRVNGFTLPDPGVYRAFVDIVVAGHPVTLGFDLFASGSADTEARLESSRQDLVDGYEVELLTDEVTAGEPTQLPFAVRRGGEPVTRLNRYLGARGHLVALREGDLAYLHVHPEETAPDSGRVNFGAQFPTPRQYRLFLQTKPNGDLLTTQFDITITN